METNNEVLVKAITMLITKSKAIQNYMLLEWANQWIKENEWKTDIMSKKTLSHHEYMKKDLLLYTTEKQIYKNACDEYADITSLLFN